ncbi:MAG TPA: ADYC domain-containing protein [Kofleriaceae bacterium]
MRQALKILIAPTMLFAGCMAEPEPATSTANQALTADNGVSFNGISFNGISFNGVSFNGISFNGVSFNGISFNGISFNGISFNGISFNGISFNGISYNGVSFNGTDFNGAEMTGVLTNGASLGLRIDDVAALDGANSDVLAYAVSVASDDGWVPLCGYEPDGSVKRALAVPGTWNFQTGAWSDSTTQFSFACRHASIAKCIEFGYKPWKGYADHQHACVRMLRADYCGDGTPHTVNGTPINLYDNVGVQADTESWPVDAEWTPDGALCLNHHRGSDVPSCYADKFDDSCGHFDSGALLIDEYNGQ